ncbi:MAG: protein-L-isoaspartate(D-aspartate) O-methyltransferase [Planctomycetota bacterium]|jgi:protein-L-isoaspartate(D-aspartate) O-methyltransferase
MIPKLSDSSRYKGLTLSVLIFFFLPALFIITASLCSNQNQALAAQNNAQDSNEPNQPEADSEKDKPSRPTHDNPAFKERGKERGRMVSWQIRKRGVTDPNVLAAMVTVPRHAFVRLYNSSQAYSDRPLPIGFNQTISQPYIVAYMTGVLELRPDFKILEIGTGSGYQAAVAAEIAAEVYTIEIVEPLAEAAKRRLKNLGYANVFVKAGDGYDGWPEKAPFDAIIVTAAAGLVPPPLIRQLKPGARMVLPIGSPYGLQTLVLINKDEKGNVSSKSLMPVRFVPMLGKVTRGGR